MCARPRQGSELLKESLGPDLLNAVGFIYGTEARLAAALSASVDVALAQTRRDDCAAALAACRPASAGATGARDADIASSCGRARSAKHELGTKWSMVKGMVDVMSQQRAAEEIVQHQENNDVRRCWGGRTRVADIVRARS